MTVSTETVSPNRYNYNAQTSEVFTKLVESIRRFGFVQPLIVREVEGEEYRYEIVNGEHRWRAACELRMAEVAIVNLGTISDVKAKQLAVILNELGGSPDEVRLADLLRDINVDIDVGDIAAVMPYTEKELSMFIDSVDFSFANLSTQDTRAPRPEEPLPPTTVEEAAPGEDGPAKAAPAVRFVLSSSKPQDALLAEELARIDADPVTAVRMAVQAYFSSQAMQASRKEAT